MAEPKSSITLDTESIDRVAQTVSKRLEQGIKITLTREGGEMAALPARGIIVEADPAQSGEFRVVTDPGYRREQSFRMENETPDTIYVQFGTDAVVRTPTFWIDPGGHHQVVIKNEAPYGAHCFAVFCSESKKYARGNSMPIIIVNPG